MTARSISRPSCRVLRVLWALAVAGVIAPSLQALGAVPPAPTEGAPALQAAATLLERGEYERAEEALRQLLLKEDRSDARDLLAVVLSRRGHFEEAEVNFRRAIELAPTSIPTRQRLVALLMQRQRQDEAMRELRGAARHGPLDRRFALLLADAEIADANPEAARAQLESVAQRSGSVRALLELARLDAAAGRHEAAVAALRRARELAPNSEAVLSMWSKVSLAAGTPAAAIHSLEALARMHPGESEHAYLLGVTRMQIGDLSGAAEALRRADELKPGELLPKLALARALVVQKDFENAREAAEAALPLDPGNAETLAVLAESDQALGFPARAEQHARRALAAAPEHPRALMTLGLLRMEEGKFEAARDALVRAVQSEPELAKAHYQLSLAYARLGERERSAEHLALYRDLRREQDEALADLRRTGALSAATVEEP